MGFIEDNLPKTLIRRLNELRGMELLRRRKELGISKERIGLLQAVVRGEQEVDDLYALLDIHLYCLKEFFHKEYMAANIEPHSAARDYDLTYDPAKNGKNVIKHGITFREVISFSPGLGTLIVPCPNQSDGERLAIFSKLVVPDDSPLVLPTAKLKGRSDLSTITFAIVMGLGFRFISSRAFAEEDWGEALNNAAKDIYPEESQLEWKTAFIDECQQRVRSELFGDKGRSGDHGPVRLVRART